MVDGANLSGYYINASKEGSATIALVNHASVDWLEAGGSKTNMHVIVDNSTLNGANAETDYDRTEKNQTTVKIMPQVRQFIFPIAMAAIISLI